MKLLGTKECMENKNENKTNDNEENTDNKNTVNDRKHMTTEWILKQKHLDKYSKIPSSIEVFLLLLQTKNSTMIKKPKCLLVNTTCKTIYKVIAADYF